MTKKVWIIMLITVGFIALLSLASSHITKNTDFIYETGIRITEDFQVIENEIFHDIPIGIAIWSSGNYIANCTFINCVDEGIVIFGSNNIIENCVFYKCVDGIELQKSSNNKFINCRFISSSHAGVDAIMDGNNNNLFEYCIFYDNPYGCYFSSYAYNEFENCTFLNNKIDVEEGK